jgi:hypothetical protein
MPITTNLSSLTINSVLVPAVGSYSWNETRDAIDCTEIGSSESLFIHGLRNCTLNFDVFYLESAHAAFEAVIATSQASTPTPFVLTLDTSDTIAGSGYMTNLNITANAGDVIRASFTLQVSGAVTRT